MLNASLAWLQNWCQRPRQSCGGFAFHQSLRYRWLPTGQRETRPLPLCLKTLWFIYQTWPQRDVLACHKVKEKWHRGGVAWTGVRAGFRCQSGTSESQQQYSNIGRVKITLTVTSCPSHWPPLPFTLFHLTPRVSFLAPWPPHEPLLPAHSRFLQTSTGTALPVQPTDPQRKPSYYCHKSLPFICLSGHNTSDWLVCAAPKCSSDSLRQRETGWRLIVCGSNKLTTLLGWGLSTDLGSVSSSWHSRGSSMAAGNEEQPVIT